jgi:hypothetical protein
VYHAALATGAPIKAVATHPTLGPTSDSNAAKWVREARKLGFLGPTTARRAGGELLIGQSTAKKPAKKSATKRAPKKKGASS